MGNVLNAFKPKPTLPEIQQNMQAKQDYYNDIKNLNAQIKVSQDTNLILPETAAVSYRLLRDTQKWLKDNPDANASDILTSRLDLLQKFTEIQDTEGSRRLILIWMATCATSSKQLLATKTITEDDDKNIQTIVESLNKWYLEKKFTATKPDFDQKAMDVNDELQTQLSNNQPALSFIALQFQNYAKLTPAQLSSLLKQNNIIVTKQTPEQKKQTDAVIAVQEKHENEEKQIQKANDDPISTIQSTALNTFFTLLMYFVFILGGSLAANLAIGRTNMYRVLYFIYGCIPFFAPIVILYTIYRRIRYGPVPLYGILPLSIQEAETRLGKILWYPFYWIPDDYSIEQTNKFLESLKLPVAAVAAAAAAGATVAASATSATSATAGAT